MQIKNFTQPNESETINLVTQIIRIIKTVTPVVNATFY